MRLLTSFVGKNRDFRAWLAAQKRRRTVEVIYLQHCELCGRMAKGPICRKCEPTFLKWTRIIKAELKAETNKEKGRRIGSQQPDNPIIA